MRLKTIVSVFCFRVERSFIEFFSPLLKQKCTTPQKNLYAAVHLNFVIFAPIKGRLTACLLMIVANLSYLVNSFCLYFAIFRRFCGVDSSTYQYTIRFCFLYNSIFLAKNQVRISRLRVKLQNFKSAPFLQKKTITILMSYGLVFISFR